MAVRLTPKFISKLKSGAVAFYINDALIPGLALRIAPSGERTWSVRYRVGKRQRRLTLGALKVLSLADARTRAKDALKLASNGGDPAATKQERRDADTVGEFAEVYIEQHAKKHKKSWKIDQMRLNIDVLPAWRHRLVKDITRRDVRDLLDDIAKRPAPIVANRVRSLLHKMWNIAIQLDVVPVNVVTGTIKPGVEQQRDRVLTADELRQFWQATDALPATMRDTWRLRLLTAARREEVLTMRWVDVDLDAGWWTIPAAQSKNKMPHRVPLSASALDILSERRTAADARMATQKTPKTPVYVFEGARGKRQQAEAAASFGIANFEGHDLRRTAASLMTGSGVPRLTVSKILNHVERGVTSVYDRYGYDNEKRVALDAWARTLTAIIEQKSADVLAFARSGS